MSKCKTSNDGNTPQKGLLFIISAPAGTGKTTLVDRLCADIGHVRRSVSCTTRAPREGEIPWQSYRFLTAQEFSHLEQEGAFLECAQVFGNLYGTLQEDVDRLLDQGQHVILVIDTQGALQLKTQVEAITIFLKPPSMEALRERLQLRGTDSAESIEVRLTWAQHELELARQYDYVVCNDQLEAAYDVLRSIVVAEEHRNRHPLKEESHGAR